MTYQVYLTDGKKSRSVVKNSTISGKEKCDILFQLAQEIGLTAERPADDKVLVHGSIGNATHDGESHIGPRECLKPADIGIEDATPFSNDNFARIILRTSWMKPENNVQLKYMKLRVEDNIVALALYKNCVVDVGIMRIENFALSAFNLGK